MKTRKYCSLTFVSLVCLVLFPFIIYALPGDLDSSGKVDGFDLIIFSLANGSKEGDSNYNPDADLTILSTHFGNNGIAFSLWVSDHQSGYHRRISNLSPKGNILKRISGFNYIRSISSNISDGTVWVADYNNKDVKKLSSFNGKTLITVKGLTPQRLSVNSYDGSVWVADSQRGSLIKLLPDIPNDYTIGTDIGFHIIINGFNLSESVAVNPVTGDVWVVDRNNKRVV